MSNFWAFWGSFRPTLYLNQEQSFGNSLKHEQLFGNFCAKSTTFRQLFLFILATFEEIFSILWLSLTENNAMNAIVL